MSASTNPITSPLASLKPFITAFALPKLSSLKTFISKSLFSFLTFLISSYVPSELPPSTNIIYRSSQNFGILLIIKLIFLFSFLQGTITEVEYFFFHYRQLIWKQYMLINIVYL